MLWSMNMPKWIRKFSVKQGMQPFIQVSTSTPVSTYFFNSHNEHQKLHLFHCIFKNNTSIPAFPVEVIQHHLHRLVLTSLPKNEYVQDNWMYFIEKKKESDYD